MLDIIMTYFKTTFGNPLFLDMGTKNGHFNRVSLHNDRHDSLVRHQSGVTGREKHLKHR